MISTILAALTLAYPIHLNVQVDGEGYLRFAREGRIVYSASAPLSVENGLLSGPGGATILPALPVAKDACGIDIDLQGNVTEQFPQGTKTKIGRLVLALFEKGQALTKSGDYLLAANRPKLGNPGDDTNGVIRMGTTKAGTQKTPAVPSEKPKAPGQAQKPSGNEAQKADVVITVAPTSEVDSAKFLLGDIATIDAEPGLKAKLEQIEVGDTPIIGVSRAIFLSHITTRLRMALLNPDLYAISVPRDAQVTRKCQRVHQSLFVEAVQVVAKEKLGIAVPLVSKDMAPDFCLPIGKLELIVENCSKTQSGVNAIVGIIVDGRRINSRNINLVPDDSVQGVKAGDTVKVRMRSAGVTVEVKGRVRQAGWVGQTVTVVTDTGSTHSGVVVSSDTVEVKM